MKILIGIMTCHAYRYSGTYHSDAPGGNRVALIRETWKKLIPEGVDFKFFYGRGEGQPKDDEIFLDVHDGFFASTKKVQAILKYGYDNGYDFVLQCDDDVFINVPAILQSDFASYDYHGCATTLIDGVNYPGGSRVPFTFVCNFAVWFSRKAMEIIINTDVGYNDFETEFNLTEYINSDNVQKIKWHADLWNGQTLSNNGIIAHGDVRYIIETCRDIGNGPPSTYPLELAYAVHVPPRYELMHQLYDKIK